VEVVYVLRVRLTIPVCWQWANSRTLSGLIQRIIYTVEVWFVEVGLCQDRPGCIYKEKETSGSFKLHFFAFTLPCSESAKYLGVILESRQPWRDNMKTKVKKAQNFCGPIGGSFVQHRA
jgi:hypothetical protein